MKRNLSHNILALAFATSLLGSCGGNGSNPASPMDTQGPDIGTLEGPLSVEKDLSATYRVDPVDPSGINTQSYQWDWNADGSIEATTQEFTYTPTSTGTFDLLVSVSDTLGNRSEKTRLKLQ